jgi:DNA-directed RNA polymerase specialized sigma24 family protein
MSYDIGVALRRFKPLIRWTAWRFSQNKNFYMTFEDIESEGFLTLVECCRDFPIGEVRFARYFKRSWYNRLKDLHRYRTMQKRQGFEVELKYAEALPERSADSEFFERMKSKYEEIYPSLSDDARRLLQNLLEPCSEIYEEAYRDFCRKNKLHSLGQSVTGYRKFRVRMKHIRKVLGMSSVRMREVVREVKSASRLNS